MIFLLHVDSEAATALVDGRLFVIPPNELFEVPEIRGTDCNNNGPMEYVITDKQVAQKLIAHCWYHGVVEVPMTRTKGGVTSDIETARKVARQALETAEDTILTQYVEAQQERVIRENKPAIPPSAPLIKIIEKRGINLKKEFNIDPPGYNVAQHRDRDAEMDVLRKQVEELTALLTSPKELTKK